MNRSTETDERKLKRIDYEQKKLRHYPVLNEPCSDEWCGRFAKRNRASQFGKAFCHHQHHGVSRLRTRERTNEVQRDDLERSSSREQRQIIVRTIRLHALVSARHAISNDMKRVICHGARVEIASKCVIESSRLLPAWAARTG